jgi:hypothetical protein
MWRFNILGQDDLFETSHRIERDTPAYLLERVLPPDSLTSPEATTKSRHSKRTRDASLDEHAEQPASKAKDFYDFIEMARDYRPKLWKVGIESFTSMVEGGHVFEPGRVIISFVLYIFCPRVTGGNSCSAICVYCLPDCFMALNILLDVAPVQTGGPGML